MSLSVPDNLPDSPFLPGTTLQYAWDSVSLTAAMACWRRYQYKIIEGLVPKGPGRAIALDFGIAFHKAMEHYHNLRTQWDHAEAVPMTVAAMLQDPYYAKLPTHDEVTELQAETDPEEDDGITLRNTRVRTRYHLIRSVVWYLEHYADDPLHTLLLSNGKPAVELSFRIELPIEIGGMYTSSSTSALLCGHLDRVVEFNDFLYTVDYKTTKSLSRQFFADYQLSHQLTGYTLAGKVILDREIEGAMIDGIALQLGGAKFQRAPAPRTEGQIAEYLDTLTDVFDDAEKHADSGLYPMNTSACYFCEFKELCAKPPEYRASYQNMLYERERPWNPLENR